MTRIGFALFALCFILRMLAEPILKPRNTEQRPQERGRFSLSLLVGPFIVSGLAVAVWLWMQPHVSPALYIAGMLLFGAGFAGRAAGVRALGRAFSVFVDPAPAEGLRTRGVYSVIRHPLYAFHLLEMLGFLLIRPNWVSLLAIVPVVLSVAWRIAEEERMLLARYGDEYREYVKRTRRVVPFLW